MAHTLAAERSLKLEQDMIRLTKAQRTKAIHDFDQLLLFSDDLLARGMMRTLTIAGAEILSTDPLDLTIRSFDNYPRIVVKHGDAGYQVDPADIGVYLLLASNDEGEFALKFGSSIWCSIRYGQHLYDLRIGTDDGHTGIYNVCRRINGKVEMILVANVDEELRADWQEQPEYGLKELLESTSVIQCDTLHSSFYPANMALVLSLRSGHYKAPRFIGCNRQLPISQHINGRYQPKTRMGCRACGVTMHLNELVAHLLDEHHDTDPPLRCKTCSKGFQVEDNGRFAKHEQACTLREKAHGEKRYACEDCGMSCSSPADLKKHEKSFPKSCERFLVQQYRTNRKKPNGHQFIYKCPGVYLGCEWETHLMVLNHVTDGHPECRHCHLVFPWVPYMGCTKEGQAITKLVEEHEKVCKHREEPLPAPKMTLLRGHISAAEVGVFIPRYARQYFIGTAEFEARLKTLSTVKIPRRGEFSKRDKGFERVVASSEGEGGGLDEEDKDSAQIQRANNAAVAISTGSRHAGNYSRQLLVASRSDLKPTVKNTEDSKGAATTGGRPPLAHIDGNSVPSTATKEVATAKGRRPLEPIDMDSIPRKKPKSLFEWLNKK